MHGQHHDDRTPEQVTEVKSKFGVQAVGNDNFGSVLSYPLNTWQNLQAYDFANEGDSLFYQLCNAIETLPDNTTSTAATGVGMPPALENWAAAFKEIGPDDNCPNTGGACYTSYDYTLAQYTDTSVSDKYSRGWIWLMRTEIGWLQVGDPGTSPPSSRYRSPSTTRSSNATTCSLMPTVLPATTIPPLLPQTPTRH